MSARFIMTLMSLSFAHLLPAGQCMASKYMASCCTVIVSHLHESRLIVGVCTLRIDTATRSFLGLSDKQPGGGGVKR